MYDHIGEKLRKLAKWAFLAEAVGAVIGGLVMVFTAENAGMLVAGIPTALLGPAVA